MTNHINTDSAWAVDLRTSIEVGTVVWALAQADLALKGRPIPERITDLHHAERRKYEDAAVMALRMLNRDAEVYAEQKAADTAFDELAQFCADYGLDWLEDGHPANDEDALEILIHRCALKAIQRFRQTLSGVHPGLSEHLAKLDRMRTGEANDQHQQETITDTNILRSLVSFTRAAYRLSKVKGEL